LGSVDVDVDVDVDVLVGLKGEGRIGLPM